MMFSNVGHRPRTQQRIRLGATPDGKVLSLHHDYANHTSMISDYSEGCGEATPYIYNCVICCFAEQKSSAMSDRQRQCVVPELFPASTHWC